MPQRTLPSSPGDRRLGLEVIARVLCGEPLTDPFADLASWGVGVEVIEGLERAGFAVVRTAPPSSVVHRTIGVKGAVQ